MPIGVKTALRLPEALSQNSLRTLRCLRVHLHEKDSYSSRERRLLLEDAMLDYPDVLRLYSYEPLSWLSCWLSVHSHIAVSAALFLT